MTLEMAGEGTNIERVGRGYVTPVWEERILTPAQVQCLAHVRKWVQSEAEFYGRTDDEFLHMFLFGCKFNLEKIKKKMCKYYDSRRKLPQWWADRDLEDPELLSLFERKISVVLKDWGPKHPMVYLTKLSRLGEAMDGKTFDVFMKINSVNMELIIRRMGTQMVGGHWIIDAIDYPVWILTKLLSPIFLKDLITSFILATPLRVKSITVVNCPLIGYTIWSLSRPFLTQKLRKRVHIYRSDWSKIFEHLGRDYLPEEYGGNAGPLALHDEAYMKEFLSMNEFISEDNQYGYQTND